MARKTRAAAAQTREQLLDAAEQVFLDRGVARSSLEEIARTAGLTRGAVYWHFRNKADLFNALLDRVRLPLAELLPQLEGSAGHDPLRTLRELCVYTFERLATDRRRQRVYTILFHRCEFLDEVNPVLARVDALAADFERLIVGYFRTAQTRGDLRVGLEPPTCAYALRVFMLGVHRDWLRNPKGFDIARQAGPLADALFAGLRASG